MLVDCGVSYCCGSTPSLFPILFEFFSYLCVVGCSSGAIQTP